MRPLCTICKNRLAQQSGKYRVDGSIIWSYRCWKCKQKSHRIKVPMVCQVCGFTAEHKCQIDVDHIDGNHKNNAKTNIQYLCANCHRLKTFLNKDYLTNF